MTSSIETRLAENLRRVEDRVQAACARVGRQRGDVTVVAVTKYAELDWVRALVELGVTDLGESRPQQLVSRAAELPAQICWHLIGHLQRNKVDLVLPAARRIHSVDSRRLIEAISKSAQRLSLQPRLLLEVNVSGEASKDGFDTADLQQAWPQLRQLESVSIEGLMTMAPLSGDNETARTVFRNLREFRDRLASDAAGQLQLPELSMGMSGDFEAAIEEGATLIRIGSSLFEGLQ